jgi:opacity protein-like surface antigen
MVAALALPAAAWADQGLYGGFGVSQVEFKPDRGPSFNPTALAGLVGKDITPNFAAELRLGAGLGSDSNVEIDHYLGAYARGILPLGQGFSVYGLLGVTSSKVNFRGGGGSVSDTGLSYGIGADIGVGRAATIGVEWVSLMRPSGYELNALSVLAKFRF